MLLQSLRALCLAPGGPGSILKCVRALVRSTGVSVRTACCFWTDLHFADEVIWMNHMHLGNAKVMQMRGGMGNRGGERFLSR